MVALAALILRMLGLVIAKRMRLFGHNSLSPSEFKEMLRPIHCVDSILDGLADHFFFVLVYARQTYSNSCLLCASSL
jgi:hypothetical protein